MKKVMETPNKMYTEEEARARLLDSPLKKLGDLNEKASRQLIDIFGLDKTVHIINPHAPAAHHTVKSSELGLELELKIKN